jgi:hypothetical protein
MFGAILFSLSLTLVADGDLTRSIVLFDDRLTLEVPDAFVEMDDETKNLKYSRGTPPQLVLTDESTKINLAIDRRPLPAEMTSAQLMLALMQGIKTQMTINKWGASGTTEIGDLQISYLEFHIDAMESDDYDIYNRITVFIDGDHFIALNFNCTTDFGARCADMATKVQSSLKLN